jgi:TetR/AcrR family transcriptional regulator
MEPTFHRGTFDRIPPEKRALIIETAICEFANKGFDNANINVIAENAGVSVGSMYKYFDSKESLFLTAIQHGLETLEAAMRDALDSPDDLLVKTEKIVRLIQKHSRENRDLIRLYNEIASESNSELVRKLSRQLEEISSDAYTRLIRRAQEEGEVRADLDPRLYAWFVDSLFMALQFSYSCEYYQERFKIYAGDDIFDRDEWVVRQFLGFVKAAFT